MATSPILAINLIAPTQTDKTTTMNDAIVQLEAATNDLLLVDMSTGDITLSTFQFTRYVAYVMRPATADRVLTVPLIKRLVSMRNDTDFTITVGGATGLTVDLAPRTGNIVQCDGVDVFLFGTGGPGPTGAIGPAGGAINIDYDFITATSLADPGGGQIALNNATQNTATAIYIDLVDAEGTDWTTVLDSLDASTNPVKGQIRLFERADPSNWIVFNLTARISRTGYRELTVAVIGSSTANPFTAAAHLSFSFAATGNAGTPGATGDDGPAGTFGTTGAGKIVGNSGTVAAIPGDISIGAGLSLVGGTLGATGITTNTGAGMLVGNPGTAAAPAGDITVGAGLELSGAGTLDLAAIGASTLLGNAGTVAARPGTITVGAGLTLSSTGTLSSSALGEGLFWAGTWDANSNTPTLVSGVGTPGAMYTVTTAGTTMIDGLNEWAVGDKIVFDGVSNVWRGIDGNATEVVSVAGRTGAVVLVSADITDLAWNGGTVSALSSNLTLSAGTLDLAGTPAVNGLTGRADPLTVTGLAAAQGGGITVTGGTSSTAANVGGGVTVNGGVPGAGGAGGALTLNGGTGDGTGTGGAAALNGGPSGSGATGTGGSLNVRGGASNATDGAGGVANVTGGAGKGTGAGGSTTTTGGASGAGATGNGGVAQLRGGAALSTNGTGGGVTVTGGAGTGTGLGGAVVVTGGAAAAGTTTNGSGVQLVGGASGSGATGNGGTALVRAGASTATDGTGGVATLQGGAGTGTGAGGGAQVIGGSGATSATGAGGTANMIGGSSGTGATGAGGAVLVRGGAALSTNGAGGLAQLQGGAGTGTGAGGSVTIAPGAKGASGAAGTINLNGSVIVTGGERIDSLILGAATNTAVTAFGAGNLAITSGTLDLKNTITLTGSATVSGVVVGAAGGPTVTQGAGLPVGVQPNGSVYLRNDGSIGARVYESNGAGWEAMTSPEMPLGFVIPGKPATGQVYNLVIGTPCTIPAALAGSRVYETTQATSNAPFIVNKITGGSTISAIGTVTITPASHISVTLSGAQDYLSAGDVLQIVAPTQDPTLADIGITLMANRGTPNFPLVDIDFTTGVLDSRIAFTRASGATYVDIAGVLQTASSGSPRFDYDPVTHAALGLMREEARTNLFLQSNFAATWAATTATLTANAVTSPDSGTTAATLKDDGTTGTHSIAQTLTKAASALTYAVSFYVKPGVGGSARNIQIRLDDGTGTNGVTASITVATGVVLSDTTPFGTGFTGTSVVYAAASNGFGRIMLTVTTNTATSLRATLFLLSAAAQSYAGDSTSNAQLYGFQCELGAFVTSLIPTTTASATRVIETITLPVGTWYNQSIISMAFDWVYGGGGGTFFAPLAVIGAVQSTDNALAGSSSAGLLFSGPSVKAANVVTTSGNSFVSLPLPISATVKKVAVTLNAGGRVAGGVDGTSYDLSRTVTALPTAVSFVMMGLANSQQGPSGYMRRFRYWARNLSNAELAQVTT